MGEYILAHDLGTSGNKATLYDFEGRLKGSMVCSYDTHFKEEGWAEQDPEDWWRAVCTSAKGLMETTGVSKEEIACVSFSGQMMGCLLIDGKGKPLRPMIIWADTRAREQERKMVEAVGEERGYKITGHRLSASYSAAKLLWVRDQEPAVYSRAAKMLNAKDYMIYRLTGEIVTDYSDASGTNLLDITQKKWSDELLECFGIERNLLPELYPSSKIVGIITEEAARETGLTAGTPVVAGGGDGSCACVGAGVAAEGKTYCVLGSSSWISAAAAKPFLMKRAERSTGSIWIRSSIRPAAPCRRQGSRTSGSGMSCAGRKGRKQSSWGSIPMNCLVISQRCLLREQAVCCTSPTYWASVLPDGIQTPEAVLWVLECPQRKRT